MPQDPVYEEYFDRRKVVFNDIFRDEEEQPQQQAAPEQKTLDQYNVSLQQQTDTDWKQTEQDANALLNHQRRSMFGNPKQDSAEMQSVKESLQELNILFDRTITLELDAFDQQIHALALQYAQVISDCANYIRAKGSPFTQEGKTRLSMVKTLYNRALREKAALAKTAHDFYAQLCAVKNASNEEGGRPVKWHSILRMLRTADLDASQMDVTYVDHNIAGDTLRIQNHGETVYFIPEAHDASLSREDLQWEFRRQHAYDQSMAALLTVIDNIPESVLAHMLPPQSNVLLEMENTREARQALYQHPDIKYVLINDHLTQEQHDAFYDCLRNEKYVDALIRMAKELHEHEIIRAKSRESMGSADFLHNRSMTEVAASRLSALCDMQNTYAQARLIDLKRGEETVRGTLLRVPEGNYCANFATLFQQSRRPDGRELSYSPHALAQMSTIRVIDLLLGIPTRALEDYQVQYVLHNGTYRIENVVAIQHRSIGVSPLTANPLDSFGEPDINLPGVMLQNVASMIEQLNDDTLQYLLGDLFDANQTFSIRKRLHRMQKMLKQQGDKIKRVDIEQWNDHLKRQAATDTLPEPVQEWLETVASHIITFDNEI
mgnify:CR=1 FL=1